MYDSIGACESFIPNNPYYSCKEDPLDETCVLVSKKCEEMPYDLCDQWNEELKKEGEIPKNKCIQGKDKCETENNGNFFDPKQMIVLILVGVALLVLLLVCLFV